MKHFNKTHFKLLSALCLILIISVSCSEQKNSDGPRNLANIATANGSFRYMSRLAALNDGLTPTDSTRWRPRQGNRRRMPATPQWIEYSWDQPVKTSAVDLFLWDYYKVIPLPESYRITYWNGSDFIHVPNAKGLGLEAGKYNKTTFDSVETTKLRIEVDSSFFLPMNVIEWKVYASSDAPTYPPIVNAGEDRDVMIGGKTWLSGDVKVVDALDKLKWKKVSGPGKVSFSDPDSIKGTASFSKQGEYVLSLTARDGKSSGSSDIIVRVHDLPPKDRLDVVYTKKYSIDNPMWDSRAKSLIVNWIPHCIRMIESTNLEQGQGGLDNFIEAAKALRGEPHGPHLGYVFSNAWVHQTIESMSIALMVDPNGDKEIMASQEHMKKTLEKWIPIVLAAQEPDGYLQTAFTLRDTTRWKERWSPAQRGTHEGYVAGYFIESAINHYTLTEGTDKRLYDAAKKLADCWVDNIGQDKKEWFDGHQEMEQALVRFGRFVNDMEGNGRGDDYIKLAKFLLDSREGGNEYDQSHLPVTQQYEAVGHAVRAVYNYSGMADVAAETGDIDYQSAVMSLWDNMVNKKYYVTGGVGSGETSEGFGPNYSLRNSAYCESCSSCGLIFFQYKMNLAYHDAKYADLYEETMYNALLGSLDMEGENFYYTNPLVSNYKRYPWHVCPCCVGNIPRTLLMIPTWTYVKSPDAIYVNLYIGSSIKVENVAGTDVQMIQKTDYPWNGDVSVTVNPEEKKEFALYVRVPDRHTSVLYSSDPEVQGIEMLTLNGVEITPEIENGYAVIKREWEKGDNVSFSLPMEVQRIAADEKILADTGRIALRYGPLIYNVEEADQENIDKNISNDPLTPVWRDDLLGGIVTLEGKWNDGSPLVAIPYYARNNRIPDGDHPEHARSMVWIKAE
ncbi:glycoside hydrolase family 127 protein [Saccharicrinis sp. FJH2]|uniref:glycoside hydrolase family 127 protein n=1 Tax=Saccharicrinis sp. FJH65 TaxID=3344659 RepID=UPI0035F33958